MTLHCITSYTMTTLIPMTRGHSAMVDDEDVKWLKLFSWCASIGRDPTKVYAVTRRGGRKAKNTFMHRIIIDCPDGLWVDHINGNTLDNRKENLRVCTPRQNNTNALKRPNKHGYRGVQQHSINKKFYARVKGDDGRAYGGGRGFDTAEEAARKYDELARLHQGDFAVLNFPTG